MTNQELWYDIDHNRHYILKDGYKIECDATGKEAKYFIPYCTGSFSYKNRIDYSNKTGKTHLLPIKPKCLLEKSVTNSALYRPSLSKLDGYMQFPRPISKCLNSMSLVSPNSFATLPQDPKMTCTFFSQRAPSHKKASYFTARTEEAPKKTARDIGLPSKKTLYGSSIKAAYLASVKETFKPLNNISKLSAETVKLLSKGYEEDRSEVQAMAKSYIEIQAKLKSEQAGLFGYQPPIEKEKQIPTKGLYGIRFPTEGELCVKAREWRMSVNPKAHAEEAKREALDIKLLKKRREQRVLKNKAMETIIRAKEKELEKEIQYATTRNFFNNNK